MTQLDNTKILDDNCDFTELKKKKKKRNSLT